MFTAHLPAGYIAARLTHSRIGKANGTRFRTFLLVSLLGAIAPDFDLVYFYITQLRQPHHALWPHYPALWASLLLLAALWYLAGANRRHAALLGIFAFGGLLHMVLDTVVGGIWWLAPFDMSHASALFTVKPGHHPWWLNFVLHWTFLLELAIDLWALYLWREGRLVRVTA